MNRDVVVYSIAGALGITAAAAGLVLLKNKLTSAKVGAPYGGHS